MAREHRLRYELPSLTVHPRDEMWQWSVANCSSPGVGRFAYYRSGLAISDTLREIALAHGLRESGAILDFACGYGRSLRYTVQDFGDERVWASEILPDAVSFVADEFGCKSFQSATDPSSLVVRERFDLIFVSSLFSHLPERTFILWLRRLHELLTPDGLLAISVHDEILLPPGASLDANGFYYQPTTEVADLDTSDYGATVVNEAFMAAAIKEATGGSTYRRLPTGLCFEQDIYLIPASDDVQIPSARLSHGSQGAVDEARLDDSGALVLRGWAAIQDLDDAVVRVELRLDGRFVGVATPAVERPDVAKALHQEGRDTVLHSEWRLNLRLDASPTPGQVLTAVAVTDLGRRDVVWCTPLEDIAPGVPATNSAPGPIRNSGARRVLVGRCKSAARRVMQLLRGQLK